MRGLPPGKGGGIRSVEVTQALGCPLKAPLIGGQAHIALLPYTGATMAALLPRECEDTCEETDWLVFLGCCSVTACAEQCLLTA